MMCLLAGWLAGQKIIQTHFSPLLAVLREKQARNNIRHLQVKPLSVGSPDDGVRTPVTLEVKAER